MDDMISRQALLAEYDRLHVGEPGRARKMIEDAPSAQPKIVRCKDCKWKQGSECVRFAEVRPFPDDFCSRAERRKQ